MTDYWKDYENNKTFSTTSSRELLAYITENNIKNITNIVYIDLEAINDTDNEEDYLTEHWLFKEN